MLDDSNKTEAAATAFDHLWKEEEQAAGRATAKKAKKQRQKARKQQNQSLQLFDSPSRDLSTRALQVLSETSTEIQAGGMYGADLSSGGNEPSCSSSSPIPVACQLFKAEDIASPIGSNPHSSVQQSSQLGSGVSRLEADLAQLSLADPQSPKPSNRDPCSSTLSSRLPSGGGPQKSPEGSSKESREGSPVHQVPDLSSPEGSSRTKVAEQHPTQTEAKDSLAFEPNGNSPDLAAGQTADAEAADTEAADAEAVDAEADFLHTLFSCPITKVGCAPCLFLCMQSWTGYAQVHTSARRHQDRLILVTVGACGSFKRQLQCMCWDRRVATVQHGRVCVHRSMTRVPRTVWCLPYD